MSRSAQNSLRTAKIARTVCAHVRIHLTCAFHRFTFAVHYTVLRIIVSGAVLELVECVLRVRSPRNQPLPRSRCGSHNVYYDVVHRGGQSRDLVGRWNSRRTFLRLNRAGRGRGMLLHGALRQPPVCYCALHGRERIYCVHRLQDAGLRMADGPCGYLHCRRFVRLDDRIAVASVDCGGRTYLLALQLRRRNWIIPDLHRVESDGTGRAWSARRSGAGRASHLASRAGSDVWLRAARDPHDSQSSPERYW